MKALLAPAKRQVDSDAEKATPPLFDLKLVNSASPAFFGGGFVDHLQVTFLLDDLDKFPH